jgi:sarcosine oxidase delta subunit
MASNTAVKKDADLTFMKKTSNAERPTPNAQLKSKKFSDFVFARQATHLD